MDNSAYFDMGDGYLLDPDTGMIYDPNTQQWFNPTGSSITQVGSTTVTPNDVSTAATQIQQAATSGADIGTVTKDLMQLGYTAAQLAMLYQNVKVSSQATPQMLQYLGQENAYLQQSNQGGFNIALIAALGILAVVLLKD